MLVRTGKESDADRLTNIAMGAKAYWGYDQAFMDSCRDELTVTVEDLKHADKYYLLVEQDGHVWGFATLNKSQGNTCELEALFVAPECIGQGMGKVLFTKAIDLAKNLDVDSVEIHSDPYAAEFYKRMGCIPSGWVTSQSISGRKLPVFIKRIKDHL